MKAGRISTNSISCQKQVIIKQLCQLVIRARNKNYRKEIVPLIQTWNFEYLFAVINQNYNQILISKNGCRDYCEHEKGCTEQFCNENKLTHHDE
jgi:hypothetical protein